MKLQRAVFLDFDGVLFDTVKEAYLICLLGTGRISSVQEIDYESEDFANFKKYRYLIGPAWNYFYLLQAMEKTKTKNTDELQNTYLEYLAKSDEREYRNFENNFFATREYLKKNHEEVWFKLNTPYSFLFSLTALINKYPNNFFIVTTKDADTVWELLKINGQNFYRKNIYGRDNFAKFKTKLSIIKNIIKEHVIEDAIFVDDNKNHLSGLEHLRGLKVLQPEWGYASPGDNALKEDDILASIRELLEGA